MTVRSRGWLPGNGWPLAGLIALLVLAGVALLTVGLRSGQTSAAPPAPPATPVDPVPPTETGITDLRTGLPVPAPASAESTPSAPADADEDRPATVRPLPRSGPLELDIPAIKVRTRVTEVGLNPDGTVEVPSLRHDSPAGWYKYLATPGELGPAVILGHVDSARNGPAVFYRLGELRRGDTVSVTRADGAIARFTVRSVHQVAKSKFPTQEVYGPTTEAELRLVTCGGTFDRSRRSYRDNIIVYATLRSVVGRPA